MLADLRYTGKLNSSGEDVISITASDGNLQGNASSTVQLSWPTGVETRPPTLFFRLPTAEIPEDESVLLGSVRVGFGDGGSVVQGRVRCSAGTLVLDKDADTKGWGVFVIEGGEEGDSVILKGLPGELSNALSKVTYMPPKDWNSRTHGVVTLALEVQPEEDEKVSSR